MARHSAPISQRLVRPNVFGAVVFGLIAYAIVSFRHPLGWSMPVWIVLAFVAAPAVIGLAIGKPSLPRAGATAAFKVGAVLMFCYTALGLMRAHAQLASSPDAGQLFFIGVFVSLVYAAIAGCVACAVNLARSQFGAR